MNRDYLKNKPVSDAHGNDDNNSGFVLGVISAILLIVCIGTLIIFNNKQVQRLIGDNITVDTENSLSENKNTSTLLTEKKLNIKASHPNGTIGRLSNISFQPNNTVVEIAITNGFSHTIYLNFHGKGLVIVDDLGNKYNFKPPFDNPYLHIESGTTFTGKLVFEGGITTKANNLTLITNNQIGSDEPFTRRPKMEFFIPISQEDKLIQEEGGEEPLRCRGSLGCSKWRGEEGEEGGGDGENK